MSDPNAGRASQRKRSQEEGSRVEGRESRACRRGPRAGHFSAQWTRAIFRRGTWDLGFGAAPHTGEARGQRAA